MKSLMLLFLPVLATASFAQSPDGISKHGNNLFHPTPKDQMRDFEADRPDVTESPYTVDAGHFQLETDLFKTEHVKTSTKKSVRNSFNVANLKLGITNTLDLQVVVESFVTEKTTSGNFTDKNSGFGDITIRAKQNIWGNDAGKTAFAILPFVNIPVGSREKISGGLTLPFSISLPKNWNLGAQVEADLAENQLESGYRINFLASTTVTYPLFKQCDFFVEGLVAEESEMKTQEYFLDCGLVYSLEENIKIDTGLYYGLKGTSAKVYFIGLSFRL